MINIYSLIIIFGWLLIILFSSLLSAKFFPEEKELSRKIVHIGSGPIIALAWWFNLSRNLVVPLACLITLGLFLNYKFRVIKSIEDIGRKSFGTISYGASISFLSILFWDNYPSAVIAGVLVMSFGDGFAGLIGRKIKSPTWIILDQTKSIVGTLIMGITGIIVLLLVNQMFDSNLTLIDILKVTSLAVILEQISPFGIDNITVPIGVALAWCWLLLN